MDFTVESAKRHLIVNGVTLPPTQQDVELAKLAIGLMKASVSPERKTFYFDFKISYDEQNENDIKACLKWAKVLLEEAGRINNEH